MSNLLTRRQASEILKLKTNTLYKWERKGLLKPSTHVNGRPRYTIEDLAEAATANNNFKLVSN